MDVLASRGGLRRLAARGTGTPGLRGALVTSYAQLFVGAIIQIALVPLYLDHLGRYRFGVLMMMLSFVTLAAIGVTWLSGSSLRLLSEAYATGDEDRFRATFAATRWTLVAYATSVALLVGGILLWATTSVIDLPARYESDIRGAIVVMSLYLIVTYALNADRVALTARGRQAASNLLTILSQAVYGMLAVVVILAGGHLVELATCLVIGMAVAVAASTWHWRRLELASPIWFWLGRERREHVGALAGRLGAGYFAYGVLALALQSDTLLVGWLAGPEVAATFVIVWRIAEFLVIGIWRYPDVRQPFIMHSDARGEVDLLRASFRRDLRLVGAAGIVAGLGYALSGPLITRLWVGGAAPQGRDAFLLAGGAVAWLCLARVSAVYAYATVRLGYVTILMAVELVAKLGLILALEGRFGYRAPLIAINVVHVGGVAVAYLFLGRRAAAGATRAAGASPVPEAEKEPGAKQ